MPEGTRPTCSQLNARQFEVAAGICDSIACRSQCMSGLKSPFFALLSLPDDLDDAEYKDTCFWYRNRSTARHRRRHGPSRAIFDPQSPNARLVPVS